MLVITLLENVCLIQPAFVLVERICTLQFDTIVALGFMYDPVEADKNGLCNN
jgi:hypothetical protein